MAQKLYEETNIRSIADAIRAKNGLTTTYKTSEMAAAIAAIPSGGGGEGLPEEALKLTGNGQYRFYKNGWNWYIENYGSQCDATGLSNFSYMFGDSNTLKHIPMTLSVNSSSLLATDMFYNCNKLETLPTITGEVTGTPTYSSVNIKRLLYGCRYLRNAENLFANTNLDALAKIKMTSAYSCPQYQEMFSGCYSLRQLPSWLSKIRMSETSTAYPSASYHFYYNAFNDCYTLDEITNIPVVRCAGNLTANAFASTFADCFRAKNVTFETQEDGSPFVVNWKSQVIDLTIVGSCTASTSESWKTEAITYHNSGITKDKEANAVTYESLKNDPDWYASSPNFSRYNHDSAVATINSLPDTSAYLASAGGTNTIKFNGVAGSLTDGGAINTLTEEEIAVATAKGWTVTLV